MSCSLCGWDDGDCKHCGAACPGRCRCADLSGFDEDSPAWISLVNSPAHRDETIDD